MKTFKNHLKEKQKDETFKQLYTQEHEMLKRSLQLPNAESKSRTLMEVS